MADTDAAERVHAVLDARATMLGLDPEQVYTVGVAGVLHTLNVSDLTDVLSELASLRRWKQEAMTVLAEWDRVHEALGRPGALGESKASGALAAVDAMGELDSSSVSAWLLHGRVRGYCSNVVRLTHGGLPLTAAEEALPEDHVLDLCLSAVRIYDQGVPS